MQRWFGIATGVLGYPPDVAWRMTVAEFFMVLRGYNDAHRTKPEPMTRSELAKLIEQQGGAAKRSIARKGAKHGRDS